jgi:hypothetical protein
MSRKKVFQLISIIFLVVGVLLSVPGTDWHDTHSTLAFSSLVLGTLGSLISIFIPSNYTFYFTKEDWIERDNGYKYLFIDASKHGQGISPTVQVFMNNDSVYQEIGAATGHKENGDVSVGVSKTAELSGKVVIS